MKPSDYRRDYERVLAEWGEHLADYGAVLDPSLSAKSRLAAAAAPTELRDEDSISRAVAVAGDRGEQPELRIAALQGLGIPLAKSEELVDFVLGLLRDESEPVLVRRAALALLRQASFHAASFAPKRPDYLQALRGLLDDADDSLRERALEVLAIKHDEYAQRRLVEGLEDASRARIAPEKAIQLLGYDLHGEHYALLRELVHNPPNRDSKHEAVRLLGADAESRALLAEIVEDTSEDPEIRSTGAVALQAVAPEEFAEIAKRIVVDEGEDEQLRATCLNALSRSPPARRAGRDADFEAAVAGLRGSARSSRSSQLERAASAYLSSAEGEAPE